jgi:hypothetical protein
MAYEPSPKALIIVSPTTSWRIERLAQNAIKVNTPVPPRIMRGNPPRRPIVIPE